MRERILEGLSKIEKEDKVKILYACESGSRAWGFESEDSDYDVRFFFVKPQEYYNSVFPENYANLTLDRYHSVCVAQMVSEDLDYCGHDVKKALYLISKGNPDIISWLYSPIQYLETFWSKKIRSKAERFFSTQAGLYHYAHMASRNFSQYIMNRDQAAVKTKKYLYVIRPVICCLYIEMFHKAPPMIFSDCLRSVSEKIDDDVLEEINNLIEQKRQGHEFGEGRSNPILNKFCSTNIEYFLTKKLITPIDGMWAELDALFNELIINQGGPHGSYLSPCKAR